MDSVFREFQIFVKPAGAVCNLHCSYCYYLDKKNLYPEGDHFRMEDNLLENYIKQLVAATDIDSPVFFSWHGGEPMLAGLEFFEKAVALQKRLIPRQRHYINGIQTNGTLLNDEWCQFLAHEKFMVGISLDGPDRLHDRYRIKTSGMGSFRKALSGLHLLQKHGINPEILCVVHAGNVGHPLEVYRFFKTLGVEFLTFLPLVERIPGSEEQVNERSVPPEKFGRFLIRIFDEWSKEDVEKISVQIFDEALRTAFLPDHSLCIFKKECGGVPVVEHNGDFYSCDHYVRKENNPGNIRDHSLSWYLDHPLQKAFGEAKSSTLPNYCRNCSVLDLCNGECPKNRFIRTPDGEPGLNYLCEGYRSFFTHCLPFVEAVRQAVR
jgi:uncharacterized protein